MSVFFPSIRFVLALLTVLAIAAKPLIPPRTLLLYPSAKNSISIYGPPGRDGASSVEWLDKATASWRCDYIQRPQQSSCGFVVSWNAKKADQAAFTGEFPHCQFDISDPDADGWGWEDERSCVVTETTRHDFPAPANGADYPACGHSNSDPNGDGWGWEDNRICQVRTTTQKDPLIAKEKPSAPVMIDAGPYDGFEVKIHYEGRAEYLYLNLRDAGSVKGTKDGAEKFMSALVNTADLRTGSVFVGFNAFTVDEWWVLQQNPPRELTGSEFRHLVQLGVHHAEFGVHRMRVDEIKLVGQRISNESYLTIIMLIWIGYLLTEAGFRYRQLKRSAHVNLEQLRKLADDSDKLEHEKTQLKSRSATDTLTGVANRTGLAERVRAQYGGNLLPPGTGLVVMDMDHFKRINDSFGHDTGDQVLRNFAALVSQAVRERDIFARWGGEEFVLLVDTTSAETLRVICEKLRQLLADKGVMPNREQAVTISMGAAFVNQIEDFDTTFKRADTALYRAKTQRNTVVYAH